MGISKTHNFNDYQNLIANIAKAFAHPARVAILEQIITHKSCIVGSLTDVIPLSQSTISQHLKELKNLGIIKGEIEGPSICYCINEENWEKYSGAFKTFVNRITENCC